MYKRSGFIFLFLVFGLLVLTACGGTAGNAVESQNTGGASERVKQNDALGSAPQALGDISVQGPAARGATGVTSDAAAACLTPQEAELARLVNDYRGSLNLPPIQVSKSLTLVAQQHAWDSTTNGNAWPAPPPGKSCNLHSWTDRVNPALQQGTWTAVCYTSDHANAQGMWNKPGELAGYPGIGVENSFAASNGVTPSGALTGWKNSPGHNAVITEQNGWTRPAAMGVGINGNFAHLWFGYVADPAGEAPLCGGGTITQPTTAAPTAEQPTVAAPTTQAPTAEQPTVAAPTAEQPTTAAPTDEQPTAVPPTAVPPTTASPTGEILNQTGTIAAGGSFQHTFDTAQGKTYTVVVTPSAEFDVDPRYSCTTGTGSASGGFDWNWEGMAETFNYTAAGNGSCTISILGYEGSTGTYTLTVTAK
jgi:cell division septation protein DedD